VLVTGSVDRLKGTALFPGTRRGVLNHDDVIGQQEGALSAKRALVAAKLVSMSQDSELPTRGTATANPSHFLRRLGPVTYKHRWLGRCGNGNGNGNGPLVTQEAVGAHSCDGRTKHERSAEREGLALGHDR
jgi:hypothetical protein